MNSRMHVILEEKININGRLIFCKVLSPTSMLETRPYLLAIPGGPGFAHASTEGFIIKLENNAASANSRMPNIILFDPLGCGVSDMAEDIEAEYSMNNFTDIAANVVASVKHRLCPNQQMDLRVYGGSFGSLTAMDLPLHRPEWLDKNADIHLKQIISHVGPNGAGDEDYVWNFLEEHYKDNSKYESIKLGLKKLLDGEIKNLDDYIENIVFNLAPLYSAEHEKLIDSAFGKLLRNYHHQIIPVMKAAGSVGKKIGFDTGALEFMIMGLTGCSIDVLNQFFRTKHSGVDIIDNVRKHRELYQGVNIVLISSSLDHMCNPAIAQRINDLLPETSGVIILEGTHHAARGAKKDVIESIFLGLICQGNIPQAALDDSVVVYKNIPSRFQDGLALLSLDKADISTPSAKNGSTSQAFARLAVDGNSNNSMQEFLETDAELVQAAPHPSIEVLDDHAEKSLAFRNIH